MESRRTSASLLVQKPRVFIRWENITYDVEEENSKSDWSFNLDPVPKKRIIHGVTGCIGPGEMMAIMGPSGSGKTSLLNILSMRTTEGVGGTITINGEEIINERWTFRRLMGFVTQDDLYFNTLTVRETLTFAARLKIPTSVPYADKIKRVNEILEDLDLKKCADTAIGTIGKGISGGERRRLAIGMELISDPSIILLDEPTSGLDSTSALMVIQILKRLAKQRQCTIVLTLHQPRASLLTACDKVLLMAEGKVIYLGPTKSEICLKFFADAGFKCPKYENPADFMLDLINTKDQEKIYARQIENEEIGSPSMEISVDELADRKLSNYTDTASEQKPFATEQNNEKSNAPTPSSKTNLELDYLKMDRKQIVDLLTKAYDESQFLKIAQDKSKDPKYPSLKLKEDISGNVSSSSYFSLGINQNRYPSTWINQFNVIFERSFFHKLRDPIAVITQAFNCSVIPFVMGTIYWQIGKNQTQSAIFDQIAALSFVIICQSYMAFDILLLFPTERAMYLRESKNSLYPASAFFLARTLAEMPFHVLFAFFTALITFFTFGLDTDRTAFRFGYYVLAVEMSTLAGTSLLLFFGAISANMEQSNILSSLFLIIFMIFNGFWIKKSNIPKVYRWLGYISFMRYGLQAALKAQFVDVVYECSVEDKLKYGGECLYKTGADVLFEQEVFDFDANSDLGYLLIFCVVCRVLAYIGLRFLHTGKDYKLPCRKNTKT